MAISKPELACVYAALILADDDIDVTVNILLLLHAINLATDVYPIWILETATDYIDGAMINLL